MRGDRLRRLREEKKMYQEDLAKKLNVSKSSVGMYERNEREPNDDVLIKMAKLFDCTTDYLLGLTDKPKEKKLDFDPIAEHNRLLKKYGIEDSGFFDIEKWKQMGPEELKQLEDYFEFIVSKAKEKNKDSE